MEFEEVLTKENRVRKYLSDSGENEQRKRKKKEGKGRKEAEVTVKPRIGRLL